MPAEAPTIFVLFGATGDLAHRMVLPAFYQLAQFELMPAQWLLVGNGRGDVSHEDFKADVQKILGVKGDDPQWTSFAKNLRFAGGGFDETNPGSLLDVLEEARQLLDTDEVKARYIHYLAIPPLAFAKVTSGLSEHKLLDGARVVYEKPYGTSPDSFRKLDELVLSVMDEEQVYRIDHFLGKEATQNLHVLRFANTMFGNIWCGEHVEQVQIDVPETLDVADRAEFYDATGAFRDMVATHLFQVAAEIAMEPPAGMDPKDLQDARESVISAFRPLNADDVVFGQAEGFTDLPEVKQDSKTETYAAVRLWIDTERWRGVPFLLRSGKQLAESAQRVVLIIRKPDGPLDGIPEDGEAIEVSLAGSGSVAMSMILKKPGPGISLVRQSVSLKLDHLREKEALPPYVALIHDVTIGDRSLFTSSAGLEKAWSAAETILDNPPEVYSYAPGSWGPAQGDALPGPRGWVSRAETDS